MIVSDIDSKDDIYTHILIEQGDEAYKVFTGPKGAELHPVNLEQNSVNEVIEPHSTKWDYDVYPVATGEDSYWVDWSQFQGEYGDFEIVSPERMVDR